MGEFGEKFRKEREKKGFSLDDVSNVTKIGSRMLQAIEQERFDQLPGGVFNKGFIRAYAKHLGLNDEEAVTSYLACLRQAQIEAHEVWEPARPAQNQPSPAEKRPALAATRPPNKSASKAQTQTPISTQVEELSDLQLPRADHVRPPRTKYLDQRDSGVPWRILAVAAVVIVLAVVLWSRHSRRSRIETAAASPAPVTQSSAPPATPSPTASARSNPATLSSHPPAPNSPKSATNQPTATAHQPVPATPAANAAEKISENAASANAGSANNGAARPAAPTTQVPPAKPAPALTLVIRASENSWISVLADGQAVSEETLIAPAHTSIHATREIVVKTGNAAGVNFLWNGKEVPAQGAEAEVKTFTFDATGIRVNPPGPAPAQSQ